MTPIADVEPVVIVALVGVAVLVVVIAVALIVLTKALKQVAARLDALVGEPGGEPPDGAPAEDVLNSIADLKAGQQALENLLASEDVEQRPPPE